MGYLKLKKANGEVDLIPADGVIHVTAAAGVDNTSRPTAKVVYNTLAFGANGASQYLEMNIFIGAAKAQPASGATKLIRDAVNDAIIKAHGTNDSVLVEFDTSIGASAAGVEDGGYVHEVGIGEAAATE